MSIKSKGWLPGKADAEKQRSFVQCYEALKVSKASEDAIYFMDATHPHHNPVAGYGWIKRGQDHEIRSHTCRQRLNINGVINTVTLQATNCFSESRHTIHSSLYSHYL